MRAQVLKMSVTHTSLTCNSFTPERQEAGDDKTSVPSLDSGTANSTDSDSVAQAIDSSECNTKEPSVNTYGLEGNQAQLATAKAPLHEAETRSVDEINNERIERFLAEKGDSVTQRASVAEWLESGASQETIDLNVVELHGDHALQFVIERDLEKYSSQTVTVPLRKTLNRYESIKNGGWKVTGLDPLDDWQRMTWGQFKPVTPRLDGRKKPIKYETPKGYSTRAIFLDSPGIDWTETQSDPTVAIAITEGGKKAGCLQDQGCIPAIALPGINSGTKKGVGLIPEIEALCQPRRLFVLAFDSEPDTKPRTQQAIRREAEKLRRELGKRGCFLVVADWSPDEGKGIDDVWANHGTKRVQAIITDAIERHQQAIKATEAHKQQWRQQRAAINHRQYQKSRSFTPTHAISQRYFDADKAILEQATIVNVKSGMGTGKTEWLVRMLKELDKGVVMIGSRNTLLVQTAERLGGFYHLQEDKAFYMTADPHGRIACCIDSLTHFADNHFNGKIVILDEWVSTLSHSLQSSTLKLRRTECLRKLEQAIKRASVVISLDGNNSDIAINHLVDLRGNDARVIKVLNDHLGEPKDIELIRTINDDGNVMSRSDSPVMADLENTIEMARLIPDGSRKAIAIISDSQRRCESLEETLLSRGLNGIRVDSTTVGLSHVREFMKDPNAYITEYKPDYVILSPTAESGVNISIKDYFFKGVAFFCGVLDTNSQTQFLNRFRDCSNWVVHCVEYTTFDTDEGMRSPSTKEIEKTLIERAQLEMRISTQGCDEVEGEQARQELERKIRAVVDDANTRTWAKLQAQRNYEKQNTRQCLEDALREQGHNVTIVDALHNRTGLFNEVNAAKEMIVERDSNAIFNAPDITISNAIKVMGKFSASVDDRRAAEKALLLHRLPGIEDTEQWTPEFIAKVKFTDRTYLSRIERYWAVQHIDASRKNARERWTAIAGKDSLFLPDIRLDFSRVLALKQLGVDRLFDGKFHGEDCPIIQEIYTKCRRSRAIQTALGVTVGSQAASRFVGNLVRLVGGTSQSKRDSTGDRARRYKYSSPEEDQQSKSILESIQKRHSRKADKENQLSLTPKRIDPVQETYSDVSTQGVPGRAETLLQREFQPDTPSISFLDSESEAWMNQALMDAGTDEERDTVLMLVSQHRELIEAV